MVMRMVECPHKRLDALRVDVGVDQQAGEGVAQVVKADVPQLRPAQSRVKSVSQQDPMVKRGTAVMRENEIMLTLVAAQPPLLEYGEQLVG